MGLRTLLPSVVVLVVGGGCATVQGPSPIEARQPSPATVTRDNPGGDAANPVDAALQRLLSEPIGKQVDHYHTLAVHFADIANWRRTRFRSYPTRSVFRYGRDHIAVALISYTKADGDDSPAACIDALLTKGRRMADVFDVELGPMHREERSYTRGPESVDWAAAAARWEASHRQGEGDRKARAAARLVAAAKSAAAVRAARDGAAVGSESSEDRERRIAREQRQRELHALKESQPYQHVPVPKQLPSGHMAVVITGGRFNTLLKRDRYEGAMVAYESWPGTCLVQGFAVRVGSDVMLARRAVTRWVEAAAPQLSWAPWLRQAPPPKKR